ncbi:MAG: hypothetical protein ACR2J5_06225 [Geodermatophilaceae bacterium]
MMLLPLRLVPIGRAGRILYDALKRLNDLARRLDVPPLMAGSTADGAPPPLGPTAA